MDTDGVEISTRNSNIEINPLRFTSIFTPTHVYALEDYNVDQEFGVERMAITGSEDNRKIKFIATKACVDLDKNAKVLTLASNGDLIGAMKY